MTYGYDGDGRLTGIATTPGIQGLSLAWDAASRLTAITDGLAPSRDQSFGYDALDRLTAASGAYGTLGFTWDAGGNRTGRSWTQGSVTTTDAATHAGTSNRLLGVARGGQSRSLGHDAAGNVVSDTRFDGTVFAYGHDASGRLAAVMRNGVPEASYGYDAFGRRVSRTAAGVTTRFIHDPDGHMLAETNAAGVTTTEWIWLEDTPLAVVVDAATASPRLLWMHTDQLGTPQKLTDQAQAVLRDGIGEPFGALASPVTGLVDQPLRLPGQYAEPLTGLHQNWHRDYDPDLGRYLQPDPIGIAGGSNLYGYAGGNPVTYSDPDGKVPIAVVGLVVGGSAGAALDAIAGTAIGAYIGARLPAWLGLAEPSLALPEGTYCPLPDQWCGVCRDGFTSSSRRQPAIA